MLSGDEAGTMLSGESLSSSLSILWAKSRHSLLQPSRCPPPKSRDLWMLQPYLKSATGQKKRQGKMRN